MLRPSLFHLHLLRVSESMASLAQQFTGLRCPPLSSSQLSRKPLFSSPARLTQKVSTVVSAVAISNAQTREREKLKELFEDAYERCRTAPVEGVAFTIDDFHSAIDKYDFDSEVGTKVRALFSPSMALKFAFLGLVLDSRLKIGRWVSEVLRIFFSFLFFGVQFELETGNWQVGRSFSMRFFFIFVIRYFGIQI